MTGAEPPRGEPRRRGFASALLRAIPLALALALAEPLLAAGASLELIAAHVGRFGVEEEAAAVLARALFRRPRGSSSAPAGHLLATASAAAALPLGPYTGQVAPAFSCAALDAWVADLPARLADPTARVLGRGRNVHVRATAPLGDGRTVDVLVKRFGRMAWLHDLRARRRGSKARRSWLVAELLARRGVGTPTPVAYLDRWERGRLKESYFVALFEARATTMHDALAALFRDDPSCERFMDLLECAAQGVRAMHDAGFVHRDLGATNVLLEVDGTGRCSNFRIVDLNRGRIRATVDLHERARDLCRLALPSHLEKIFLTMYWGGRPPREFARWHRHYRRMHRAWVRSRRWRHPLREARLDRAPAQATSRLAPTGRDLWIWDERCGQPIAPMLRSDRVSHYPSSRGFSMVVDTARAAGNVWRAYGSLLDGAFTQPVAVAGRIGMAVDASKVPAERELELLAGLGTIPTFVRFCHHETETRRRERVRLVRALHHAGHAVAIGLVQDRRAITQPASWSAFVSDVLDDVGPLVDLVEVGHSINRTKWGLWDFDELAALYAPFATAPQRFPDVRFIGPAGIDFEYPFVLSALRRWPEGVPLAGLSHQLYVDRRGGPEAPQSGRFACVEKFALARAIARTSSRCADRLVITEVNWPLVGTVPHCPVSAPYLLPGYTPPSGRAAVGEDAYADYMIRYLALAIGSGLVERVYWWRLVARGFGLVDDTDATRLRPRPAYLALVAFLRILGEATFVDAQMPARGGDRHGSYRLRFRRAEGEHVVLAYAHGPPVPLTGDERARGGRVEDLFGQPMDSPPAALTGRPVYLRECAA